MNTPTPTPITEEHKRLWTQLYNLAHDEIFDVASSDGPAHKLIADSEAMAVAALTAERDQLRAENATLRAAQKACEACDEPTAFEVRQLRARAERAEAAETVALANWNGALERAMKAEADLATERARLDWLESDAGVDWQWSSSALTIRRAVIDAAMKEDAQ